MSACVFSPFSSSRPPSSLFSQPQEKPQDRSKGNKKRLGNWSYVPLKPWNGRKSFFRPWQHQGRTYGSNQGIDRNRRSGGNVHQEGIAMISRLLVLFVFLHMTGTASAMVPTISIDELRQLLGNPEVVILDVRHPRDWQASNKKIPGAIRIVDGDFAPIKAADRGKRFVLYCA